MESWYIKRNEAVELYHSDVPREQVVEKFEQLFQETTEPERIADIQLWKAACYRSLQEFDKAGEILSNIEATRTLLRPSTLSRLQHARADLAEGMNDFEKALKIYTELLASTTSYQDLQYLEMRVDDVLYNFESFKEHGTVNDWKKKILEKLQTALKFFAPTKTSQRTLQPLSLTASEIENELRKYFPHISELETFEPRTISLQKREYHSLPSRCEALVLTFVSKNQSFGGVILNLSFYELSHLEDPYLIEEEQAAIVEEIKEKIGFQTATIFNPMEQDETVESLLIGDKDCYLFKQTKTSSAL